MFFLGRPLSVIYKDSRLGGVGHGVCQVTATVFVDNQCFKELYRHQNSPGIASILSFASSFCGRCALLHHFTSKKIFRRSNKYLLRRYKRNMFRVVFRWNGVEHGSQEMETQYHHSLHCLSSIDRKEEYYLHWMNARYTVLFYTGFTLLEFEQCVV